MVSSNGLANLENILSICLFPYDYFFSVSKTTWVGEWVVYGWLAA